MSTTCGALLKDFTMNKKTSENQLHKIISAPKNIKNIEKGTICNFTSINPKNKTPYTFNVKINRFIKEEKETIFFGTDPRKKTWRIVYKKNEGFLNMSETSYKRGTNKWD